MTIIKDGSGTGYQAKVTSDGLLETNAVTEAEYGFISRVKQRAFVAASEAITTDGTLNDVFYLENSDSDRDIVVMQIDISMTTDATIKIKLNESYSSGGTTITSTNLNRKSTKSSIATAYYGDDMTLTGTAVTYSHFRSLADTPFREEFLDALILGYEDALSVAINAPAGTAYVSCKYYEREAA